MTVRAMVRTQVRSNGAENANCPQGLMQWNLSGEPDAIGRIGLLMNCDSVETKT